MIKSLAFLAALALPVFSHAQDTSLHDWLIEGEGWKVAAEGYTFTDGLCVDLSRHMNAILEVNAEEGWARVQAGVVKDQLNDAVAKHGLFFAPELSPSNRATIGGMIATDASGQGSVLYGKTRDHVQELRSGFGKQHRLRGGVIAIDGGAVHIAFGQTHDLTSLEIDGGKYDHGAQSKKSRSSASP